MSGPSNKQEERIKHIELEEQSHDDDHDDPKTDPRYHDGEIDLHKEDSKEDHMHTDTTNDEDHFHHHYRHKDFTPIPKKIIFLPLFLLIVGMTFIFVGIGSYLGKEETQKIASFLVFGCILSIPGCYYTFQVIQAWRAETPEEREEILDDIPI